MTKPRLLLAAISLLLAATSFAAQQNVEGLWLGTLSVQGMNLRVVFNITHKADSTLTATLDSPDQGAKGIPCDVVSVSGDSLHISVAGIGRYDGARRDSTYEGQWTQAGRSMPLTLRSVQSEPELVRPQMPKKPYPYLEEDVRVFNPKGADTLAGTFTKPQSGGPFVTAILITGSGPQDRDETLFGHKPFLVISDYLTRQGIAVLRMDDRGFGKSTGKFSAATTEDFATDVEAGLAYLKTRKDVNPKKIGLIGHSEGALIADMIAARSKDVAFVVSIAGPGVTGEEVIYEQGDLISKVQGVPESDIQRNRAMRQQMFEIVKAEKDSASAAVRLRALLKPANAQADSATVANAVNMQIIQLLSPWMRSFLTYDPRTDLKKIKIPYLAIFGEKDLQVPPSQSAPEVEKALTEAGNKHFEVQTLPGLNHLMQTAKTGSPGEYVQIEETFSPDALKLMGDWIHTNAK